MRDIAQLPSLTDSERAALGEFATRVRRRLGPIVAKITLFGSRARGEGGDDSDVDVLVLLTTEERGPRDEVVDEVVNVGLDTGVFLSVVTQSASHFERSLRLGIPFALNVEDDGVAA